MTAAVDLPAWTFMVVAVIGLTVTAVYQMVVGRRTNRPGHTATPPPTRPDRNPRPDTAAPMNTTIPVGVYGASAAPPTTSPSGGSAAPVVGVSATTDTPTTNNPDSGGER